MDKTPEHCLPSMGTQLLVGGLNFDGLSPCVELDYRGHRLVSRDRVVFTLDPFHSQQLPNGGYFSTALFRLRGFVSDAGCGSGTLRLRRKIPLLFWREAV